MEFFEKLKLLPPQKSYLASGGLVAHIERLNRCTYQPVGIHGCFDLDAPLYMPQVSHMERCSSI